MLIDGKHIINVSVSAKMAGGARDAISSQMPIEKPSALSA